MHRSLPIVALLLTLVSAAAFAEQWDAETLRYRAELSDLDIRGSMFDIQSRAFAGANPGKRVQMWADLETLKKELAKEEMQELLAIKAKTESTPAYDAETLSYQAALQKAGKSSEEVNGLLTLFSTGRPVVRQALWDDLQAQP